ncbi:MAG: family 20 glycosylhydrolase [Bacteroidales bacterium]|nr:family 20 glycosylhydrolase [Bacteroidales bacterium]
MKKPITSIFSLVLGGSLWLSPMAQATALPPFLQAVAGVNTTILPGLEEVSSLLPQPKEMITSGEFLNISAPTQLKVAGMDALPMLDIVLEGQQMPAPMYSSAETEANVVFKRVATIEGAYDLPLAGYGNEAYKLTIDVSKVTIEYVDTVGAIRAVQTLGQLATRGSATGLRLPTLRIKDWPAFKVRGYMHDVGRSFLSVEKLKQQIDLFSRFKVNTFHWHFTENQAWRLEIDAYPALTAESAMTRYAGQYYTKAQVRDVLAYAKARGVVVIPEIDMPGHSEAYRRAMNHDMQSAEGVAALKVILSEVATLFAESPYIHIGADEKDITYTATINGQTRNFVQIMVEHVHSLGKKAVIWNPIHTSNTVKINETGADMMHLWSSRGTAVTGVPAIDSRYNYTNHFDVFADLVGIYKSNIYYQSQATPEVAGAITAPWNDRKTATESDILRQNNHYAVTIATADRAWKGGGNQYIEKGGTTLPNVGMEYTEFCNFESRFLYHKGTTLAAVKDEIPYVKQSHMRWNITEPFPNEGDTARVFPPEEAMNDTTLQPLQYIYKGNVYKASTATGAGIYLRHTWGNNIVPAFYGNINPAFNQTAYAWTYVYSENARTVNALIEFQNYGRSEVDIAPEAGRWDRKGSQIWINGERIKAPHWKNAGKAINHEVDLQDENFTARTPIAVPLKKGWNKVFIKLPFIDTACRLEKWMFTCAFVDPATNEAVEGLIYSPTKSSADNEALALAISEAERQRNALVGNEVGFLPMALSAALDAKLAETKSTLADTTISSEVRQKQANEIVSLLNEFLSKADTAKIVQPILSTAETQTWYTLQTPKRDGRYASSAGVNQNVVGRSGIAMPASTWKFVARPDSTYDIVDANGLFLSPASTNNTAVRTVSAQPVKGWKISPAAEMGYVIITSGTAQLNQTNVTNTPVYNWGGGTNLSDAGCMYYVRQVQPNASQELFTNTTTADTPYRIPALAQAKNGNLIAVSDFRPCGKDIGYGDVDIVARVSKDNGTTWEASKTLLNGDDGTGFSAGFGDAALVADANSNKVLMLGVAGRAVFSSATAANPPAIFRLTSDDGGETWNAVENITSNVYNLFTSDNYAKGPMNALFFASGRIHQSFYYTKPGGAYARLYGAIAARNSANEKANFVLFSDDFGQTWQVLGGTATPAIPNGDEAKVEELPDGNLLISSRTPGGRLYNTFYFSNIATGEGQWGTTATSNASNNGVAIAGDRWGCNGEVLIVPAKRKMDGKIVNLALQSVPLGVDRANVGVYYKDLDEADSYVSPALFAKGWNGRVQVSRALSAYSTMTVQQNDSIGFLFEEDTYGIGDTYRYCIRYQKFDLSDLTNGQYTLATDTLRKDMMQSIIAANLPKIRQQAEALLAASQNVGQVGYRSQAAKETLLAALADASTPYASLFLAMTAFETSRQMPVDGGVYVFRNVQQSGKHFFLSDNGSATSLVPATAATVPTTANAYVCKTLSNGKYVFVNARTGNYLIWRNSDAKNEGYNGNKGVLSNNSYNSSYCDWALNSAQNTLEGAFYIVAKRANNNPGALIVMNATGVFDGWGNSVGYSANYSNLWRLENFNDYYHQPTFQAYGDAQYYATLYLPYAATLPEGVHAYTSRIENGEVVLTKVATQGILPANTAVVLQADAPSTATFVPSTTSASAVANNAFVGSVVPSTALPTAPYALDTKDNKPAFLPLTTTTYPLGQALLSAPDNSAPAYPLNLDAVTGLGRIATAGATAPLYDLTGRRIAKPLRGVYIKNGQKVIQ